MNIDKERVNELIQKLSEYEDVFNPRENYTVTTESRKVIGNNECFGRGLNCFRDADNGKVVFSIRVNFDILTTNHIPSVTGTVIENNLVLFTQNQLIEHMNYLREVLGLSFDMKYFHRKNTYLKITLDKKHINLGQLRLILFWLREAYAFPQNIFLVDAYELARRHPDIEIHNLIAIPILSSRNEGYDLNFQRDKEFVSTDELKVRLANPNLICVNGYGTESCYLFHRMSMAERSRFNTKLRDKQIPILDLPADILCRYDGKRALRYSKWWENRERFDIFEKVLQIRLSI